MTKLGQAGLPIDGRVVYTAATDLNKRLGRPGQYISKVNFHDTRLEESEDMGIDGGGAVETFTSEDDAKGWADAAAALEKALGSLTAPGYVYRDGSVSFGCRAV
jgi:hypothetical protein